MSWGNLTSKRRSMNYPNQKTYRRIRIQHLIPKNQHELFGRMREWHNWIWPFNVPNQHEDVGKHCKNHTEVNQASCETCCCWKSFSEEVTYCLHRMPVTMRSLTLKKCSIVFKRMIIFHLGPFTSRIFGHNRHRPMARYANRLRFRLFYLNSEPE